MCIVAVSRSGAAECEPGRVPVYQQESAGVSGEVEGDFYVFGLTPNGAQVLHYNASSNAAAWLQDIGGGTNVPIRGLIADTTTAETGANIYRFLDIRDDESGEIRQALVVDMSVYWPECSARESVDAWKSLAGTPQQ
jgi:hypothetical protein